MNIVCVGSSSKDIFFPTSEGAVSETPEDLLCQKKITFELGAKFHVKNRFEALGGCAANVACGLANLGISAACCTTIGDDLLGKWIKEEFKKRKISVILSSIKEEIAQSDLSAIVVDEKSGDRIIFTNQEANEKLRVDPEKIRNFEWVFIGDLNDGWEENLDVIIKASLKNKINVAFNPRQKTIRDNAEKVIEAIRHCKALLVNKDEAIDIVSRLKKDAGKEQLNDEKFLIQSLQGVSSEVAALTDGKRGAWAYDGKRLFYAPATGDEAVETTGAGDAFSSGFVAALAENRSVEEALKWGIANSGNSVRFLGAIAGLLERNDIKRLARGIKTKIID